MKKHLAVAALAALVAGGIVLRGERSMPPQAPAAATRLKAPVPVAAASTAPAPSMSPAGDRSYRLALLLGEIQRRIETQAFRSRAAGTDEMTRALERDALVLAEKLKAHLKAEPESWIDTVALLSGLEDTVPAVRLVGMIEEAMDPPAERLFMDMVLAGKSSNARRIGIAALAHRTSGESLVALAGRAEEDVDAGVRYAALQALLERKLTSPSPDAGALIADTARRRLRMEPSPQLQRVALEILGEAPPPPPRAAERRNALRWPVSSTGSQETAGSR